MLPSSRLDLACPECLSVCLEVAHAAYSALAAPACKSPAKQVWSHLHMLHCWFGEYYRSMISAVMAVLTSVEWSSCKQAVPSENNLTSGGIPLDPSSFSNTRTYWRWIGLPFHVHGAGKALVSVGAKAQSQRPELLGTCMQAAICFHISNLCLYVAASCLAPGVCC